MDKTPRKKSSTVAALYVELGGVYYGLPGVEPWGLPELDAREYAGPHPVVAHPPCQRWGRYWSGGPSAKVRRLLGDDNGCFAAALWAVRTFGGVLEHPEASSAWKWFGLRPPMRRGTWSPAEDDRGWTCCVEQGHYDHRARKATWLYVVGLDTLPALRWGPSEGKMRLDDGCHSKTERANGINVGQPRITTKENAATPKPFRDLLLDIARGCSP
jgi:hypothetical protein